MSFITPDIQYKDNFFPSDFALHLANKINQLHNFSLTGFSKNENEPFFWIMKVTEDEKFKEEVNFIQKYIPNKIIRGYINGQTYGQFGSYHCDDGEITYLYYPNLDWSVNDGGGTEFSLQDDNSIVVYPKFNRMCIFNSKILHRSMPNRSFTKLRMTLAFKTEK